MDFFSCEEALSLDSAPAPLAAGDMDLVLAENVCGESGATSCTWGLVLYLRSGPNSSPVFEKIVDSNSNRLGNPFRGVAIQRKAYSGSGKSLVAAGAAMPAVARIAFVDIDGDKANNTTHNNTTHTHRAAREKSQSLLFIRTGPGSGAVDRTLWWQQGGSRVLGEYRLLY